MQRVLECTVKPKNAPPAELKGKTGARQNNRGQWRKRKKGGNRKSSGHHHCLCARQTLPAGSLPVVVHGFVGLPTETFRRSSAPARRTRLLSAPLQGFNDPLSRNKPKLIEPALRFHSYKPAHKGPARVRDFHPIPLSSEEQECVSGPLAGAGSRICHKSRSVMKLFVNPLRILK